MTGSATDSARTRWRNFRLVALVGFGLGVLAFWQPLQSVVLLRLLIRSEAPAESEVNELADRNRDPVAILEPLWLSGRIPHRTLAVRYLKDGAPKNHHLVTRAEPILVEACGDVDLSVRELAFGALAAVNHSRLAELAMVQLSDSDPQARVLGLRHLRKFRTPSAVPRIIPMLDDPEPAVVTAASAVLQAWTGMDFGIRQAMAISAPTPGPPATENTRQLSEGVRRWKAWWAGHQSGYASAEGSTIGRRDSTPGLATPDFTLSDLQGRSVRLSEFHGKTVLLNFWTTWCPSCLVEIPGLIELQRRNPDELRVIGISLDGQTEDDGHGHSHGPADGHFDFDDIRRKVKNFAQTHGINYPVLLDPTASVSQRFNGSELPTNVLLDSRGFVRRRFVGGRNVAVFEAMLREIQLPPPQ